LGDGGGTTATGFTIEYSYVYSPEASKMVQAFNGNGNGVYSGATYRYNWFVTHHDFFFIQGNLDNWLVEYNVMGPLTAGDDEDNHADVFQIGDVDPETTGDIVIRGNYFDPQSFVTKTAILYESGQTGTMDNHNVTFESNRLTVWGGRTLWCPYTNSCTIRYNIYDAAWEAGIGNRCSLPVCAGGGGAANPCCGYPYAAVVYGSSVEGEYSCNRYESDGDFIEQQWVTGTTHITTGCPDYTP
jgi:hypothetical protein